MKKIIIFFIFLVICLGLVDSAIIANLPENNVCCFDGSYLDGNVSSLWNNIDDLESVKSCNGVGFMNWSNGTYVSCGIPLNTVYSISINSGLLLRGLNLSLKNCSNNQILKNVSGGWNCSEDNIGTSIPYWITEQDNTTSNLSINGGNVKVSKKLIVNDSVKIRTIKPYANDAGLTVYTSSNYPNTVTDPVPLLLVGTSQTPMAFYSGSSIQAYMKSDDAGNLAAGSRAAFIIETGGSPPFGYANERMQVSSTGQVLINTRTGDGTSKLQVEGKINGGSLNIVSGIYSVIPGGTNNIASGDYSAVMGGYKNTASGFYSAVCGGGASDPVYGCGSSWILGCSSSWNASFCDNPACIEEIPCEASVAYCQDHPECNDETTCETGSAYCTNPTCTEQISCELTHPCVNGACDGSQGDCEATADYCNDPSCTSQSVCTANGQWCSDGSCTTQESCVNVAFCNDLSCTDQGSCQLAISYCDNGACYDQTSCEGDPCYSTWHHGCNSVWNAFCSSTWNIGCNSIWHTTCSSTWYTTYCGSSWIYQGCNSQWITDVCSSTWYNAVCDDPGCVTPTSCVSANYCADESCATQEICERENYAGETGNIASGNYSAVLGGTENIASGRYSTAIGYKAVAEQDESFVIQFDTVKYVFNKSGIYNTTGERIAG